MKKLFELIGLTLIDKYSKLDGLIYNLLMDYFAEKIIFKDDKIELSQENINVIDNLDEIHKNVKKATKGIIEFLTNTLKKIFGFTVDEMSEFDKDAKEKSLTILDELMNHSATVLNKDYDLSIIYSSIKQDALNLIMQPKGITLKELREQMKGKVIGNKLAERYYYRWTSDLISQYERVAANRLRKELGLKYAVYAGDIIETSRKFCEDRVNNVYSEEEIKKWIDLDFVGKQQTGYDPIVDMGGYNCRHRYRWISDELAKRLRPELFKNKEA